MKNVISMGTLVFIIGAVALFALFTSVFNAVQLKSIKPQVTVITKPAVATQSAAPVVVEASPSATAAPTKAVVKKVVPTVSVSPTVEK